MNTNAQKGHGYLRKTKLGLLSGIVLAGAIGGMLLTSTVSADEQPTSPQPVAEATPAKPNSDANADQFAEEVTKTVKADELKAKADEVAAVGVKVTKADEENVGKAEVGETDELKAAAEEKVDAQLQALEAAKAEQAKLEEDKRKIAEARENFIDGKLSRKSFLLANLTSRDVDQDIALDGKISEVTSDQGTVKYISSKNVDVSDRGDVSDAIRDLDTTETPVLAKVTSNLRPPGTNNYTDIRGRDIPARIPEVHNNETIHYTVTTDPTSHLHTVYGISSIDVSKHYTHDFGANTRIFDVLTDKVIENRTLAKGLPAVSSPQPQKMQIDATYTFKDKSGQTIPLSDLYVKVLNNQMFGGEEVFKTSDLKPNFFAEDEALVARRPNGVEDLSTKREITLVNENSIKLTTYNINGARPGRSSVVFTRATFNPGMRNKNIDFNRLENGVSAAYHDVSYTEVTNKGRVTQKFVNDQGTEISNQVQSEIKKVGESIALTHSADIDFEGKRYTFKEQDKPDVNKIAKGDTVITYVYKQKYLNNLDPVVDEETTPSTTRYESDDNLELGKTKVKEEGSAGKKVTSTPRIVNELDGSVTEGDPIVTNTPMTPRVIAIGTKSSSTTVTIPFGTETQYDPTLEVGKVLVDEEGQDGSRTVKNTYTVNEATGEVIPTVTEENTPAKPKKVRVGAGVTSTNVRNVVTDVDFETETIEDNTLMKGTEIVVNPGSKGRDLETIVEKVLGDEVKSSNTSKVRLIDPVKRVIKIGTLEVSKPGDAPTLEVPEYTDQIGGPLDGEGGLVDPPTVEIPEYTGPVGTTPEDAPKVELPKAELPKEDKPVSEVPKDAPTVEIPEYAGPIGVVPNDAPTVEIPEYAGPIGVVPNDAPKLEVPEYKVPIAVVPNNAPILQIPDLPLPSNEPVPQKPTRIIDAKPAAPTTEKPAKEAPIQVSHKKVVSAAEVKQKTSDELPNTGENNNGWMLAAGALLAATAIGLKFTNFKHKDNN